MSKVPEKWREGCILLLHSGRSIHHESCCVDRLGASLPALNTLLLSSRVRLLQPMLKSVDLLGEEVGISLFVLTLTESLRTRDSGSTGHILALLAFTDGVPAMKKSRRSTSLHIVLCLRFGSVFGSL